MINSKKKIFIITSLLSLVILFACTTQSRSQTSTVISSSIATTYDLTPLITASKYPSSTPIITARANFYSAAGASDEQAQVLNSAISKLIEAGKQNDQNAIADLIDYPIWITSNGTEYWIENKQEFLEQFHSLFGMYFTQALSEIQLNKDYFFISYRGIWLRYSTQHTSITIIFSDNFDGKIFSISYWGEDLPTPIIEPTNTNAPTKTATQDDESFLPTQTSTPYWFESTNPDLNSIGTYFGTWVVSYYKYYENDGCDGQEQTGEDHLGNKITLLPDQVIDENGFISGSNRTYTHVLYDLTIGEKYLLNYTYTLPTLEPDKMNVPNFLFISVDRSGEILYAEVTQSGRLVVNDFCIYYFMDKVPTSTSE